MSNLVRRMAIVERLFKICEEDPFGDRLCANDQNAILTAAHTLSQMGAEQETVSDERDGAVAERSAARSEHISPERRRGLEEAAKALADAADDVGVKFFDTDTMEPEVERMQKATLAIRALIPPSSEGGSPR
jgi:hypothetical protein